MFSDPNGIKLVIKNKNMLREFPYIWKLDNIFQNNPKDQRGSLKWNFKIYWNKHMKRESTSYVIREL